MSVGEMMSDVASLPLERLEAEITEFAAHLSAAESEWLALIAEFDRREGYLEWGCRNSAVWLAWQCGLNLRAARDRVRVARALEGLPLMSAAFANGTVSYSKVRALTRIASPQNEEALMGLAVDATAAQLERIAASYRRVLDRHDGVSAHQRRYVRCEHDDDGTVALHGRLTPEQGALLMKALEIAIEQANAAAGTSRGASRADALALIAESFLANGPAARTGGDRYQVMLNFDAEVLAFDSDGACELEGGHAIDPETARRLACDCALVVAERGADGEVLNIGRKTRSIPTAIRRALRARDATCRFPGCDEIRWLDGHHGRHYAHGGETSLANLVHLCWHHHRLVHEGGWTLEILADGEVAVYQPNGESLDAPPTRAVRRDAPGIAARNRVRGINIDCNTAVSGWVRERLDLDLAIAALLSLDRPGFAMCAPHGLG